MDSLFDSLYYHSHNECLQHNEFEKTDLSVFLELNEFNLFLFCFSFWDRVFLDSPGYSGTFYEYELPCPTQPSSQSFNDVALKFTSLW